MSEAVTAEAPAKINLYLHVTGQRADGNHTLDTLIAFAAIGDRITARPGESLTLEIDGPFAGALQAGAQNPDDNLVLKAARALADYAGVSATAHINLTKNLPVAAGIGGGVEAPGITRIDHQIHQGPVLVGGRDVAPGAPAVL